MTRNTSYAIELRAGDPVPVTSTWIGGITDQSIDAGVSVNTEVTAGNPAPSYGDVGNIQPSATFTTGDIKTALETIGMQGICLAGGDALGYRQWGLLRTPCGAIDSGDVHRAWTIPNGLITLGSLSVSHGSRASVNSMVYSLWDGTNDSMLLEKALAAPLDNEFPLDVNGYHLGPLTVGGIEFVEKTSLTLSWGLSVQPMVADGDVNAKSLFIASYQPSLSVTTFDVTKFDKLAGIPAEGVHATHADTSIVLRKKVLGSGAYETGANNLQFTMDGVAVVNSVSASGHSPHGMQLTLTGMDDGTNDMIVPDFAYSIP